MNAEENRLEEAPYPARIKAIEFSAFSTTQSTSPRRHIVDLFETRCTVSAAAGRSMSEPRNAAPALLGCRSFVCDPIEHALATSQPVAGPRFRKAVDWPDHFRDRISNHDRRAAVDRGADSERQTFPNGHACGNRRLRII